MKNLMEAIISIDKKAENQLNEAIRRKQQAIEEIHSKTIQMTEKMKAHAQDLLERSEQAEQQTADEQISIIQERTNQERSRLQSVFDANQDKWVCDLVDRVLK